MKLLLKPLLVYIPALFTLILPACTVFENCICTTEFRVETVLILDNQNNPVDSLNVEIMNASGRQYIVQQSLFSEPGRYVVIDDSYTNEFSTIPWVIFFKAWNDSVSVQAQYGIITDDCKCHIYKTSGPDTLFINLN